MANFEAFHWNFSSSINSEIGRSDLFIFFNSFIDIFLIIIIYTYLYHVTWQWLHLKLMTHEKDCCCLYTNWFCALELENVNMLQLQLGICLCEGRKYVGSYTYYRVFDMDRGHFIPQLCTFGLLWNKMIQ